MGLFQDQTSCKHYNNELCFRDINNNKNDKYARYKKPTPCHPGFDDEGRKRNKCLIYEGK